MGNVCCLVSWELSHHPESVELQGHTWDQTAHNSHGREGKNGATHPPQRKDENLPAQLQRRVRADGACAHGSESTCVCVGLEFLVVDARRVLQEL